jgi:hypothetical protein
MSSAVLASDVNPFSSDPATPSLFAGRERELILLRQWLSAIQTQPQHACVVGRQGEGKTSFLQKAKSEALAKGLIACSPRIDAKRSPEQNVHTIVEALLDAIDSIGNLKLRGDWKSGKNSSFRTPQEGEVRANDLARDLQSFLDQLRSLGRIPACLLCVDDGQAIHPSALSTLRNSLQDVGAGYMLLMAVRNDSVDLGNIVEGPRLIQEFATTSTDAGLPRLFADNFIALGPFENQEEANECIRKRIDRKPTQFAETVITNIGRVAGRYPHTMMILAKAVYSAAQTVSPAVTCADDGIFRQAFISTQKPLVDTAVDFVAQKSNTRRQVYRVTLRYDGVFAPIQIARDMLGPGGAYSEADFAADPVGVGLEDLVNGRFCARTGNDQFQWSDPLRAHALRIVLS